MRSEKITIRNARPGDLDDIIGLLTITNLPTEDVGDSSLASFVVAEANGSIVGVAGMEKYGRCGLLRSVAVAPSHRNKGIATMLTRAALEQAAAGRMTEIYLLTTTADKYFSRYGFEPITRGEVPDEIKASSEFATVCPESAIIMRLKRSS